MNEIKLEDRIIELIGIISESEFNDDDFDILDHLLKILTILEIRVDNDSKTET